MHRATGAAAHGGIVAARLLPAASLTRWPLQLSASPSVAVNRNAAAGSATGATATVARLGAPRWAHARPFCFVPENAKEAHPREWAIWKKLDLDRNGKLTNQEVRVMCQKFDATSHADLLVKILDPTQRGFTTFSEFVEHFDAVAVVRKGARLKNWHRTFGIGVAGNVAGHMDQAGEGDKSSEPQTMPAAIFTFYAPHPHTIDATEQEVLKMYENFPVTNAVIDYPKIGGKVQVEPEMGLYVDIVYARDGQSVERLVPRRVAAFNDCSIRELEGSEKLRERKNWGFGSKGISLRSFRVSSIAEGTLVDQLVLSSYLKRGKEVHQYSVDAPARNYLLFHEPLLDWIVDRINNQQNVDKWDEIFKQLMAADYPTSMWIALGAGEYTEWGAANYIQPKDECLVMIYDEAKHPNGPSREVVDALFMQEAAPDGIIALHQTFIQGH